MFHRHLARQERHHTMQCNYLKNIKNNFYVTTELQNLPKGGIHKSHEQFLKGGVHEGGGGQTGGLE